MPDRVFTTDEKIRAVEHLIKDFMWARGRPGTPEHDLYELLKAIASDLRATVPRHQDEAIKALQFQVVSCRRAKAMGLLSPGHYQALAQTLLHHWDAIVRKLEVNA